MMPPYSCSIAGKVTRAIHESEHRQVEGVAETHEARDLVARLNVQDPGQVQRLVGHHAHREAVQARQADQGVGRVMSVYLQEAAPVEDTADHLSHIVGFAAVIRHQVVQGFVARVPGRRRE